mgnify:CR=1 FL=1
MASPSLDTDGINLDMSVFDGLLSPDDPFILDTEAIPTTPPAPTPATPTTTIPPTLEPDFGLAADLKGPVTTLDTTTITELRRALPTETDRVTRQLQSSRTAVLNTPTGEELRATFAANHSPIVSADALARSTTPPPSSPTPLIRALMLSSPDTKGSCAGVGAGAGAGAGATSSPALLLPGTNQALPPTSINYDSTATDGVKAAVAIQDTFLGGDATFPVSKVLCTAAGGFLAINRCVADVCVSATVPIVAMVPPAATQPVETLSS